MSNHAPLKKGQEVRIKLPRNIYAEVMGPPDAEFGSPSEPVSYAVRVLPLEQYYLPEDLELSEPPQTKQGRLERLSPEWVQELAHCNQVVRCWLANQRDKELSKDVSESMVKLGFSV